MINFLFINFWIVIQNMELMKVLADHNLDFLDTLLDQAEVALLEASESFESPHAFVITRVVNALFNVVFNVISTALTELKYEVIDLNKYKYDIIF